MNVAISERGSERGSERNSDRSSEQNSKQNSERRARASGPLPPGVRALVFLRSLTLQASWNRKGMQSLGVAFALWPALRWLYPSQADRIRAVRRHLAFFNTHPYLAAAILGGALGLEERIARGDEGPESVQRFKEALMFPFAAVGDSFFWLSLRPLAGAVAALAFPWIGAWSVLVFLAIYDVPHVALRLGMFVAGYRDGEGVVARLRALGLSGAGTALRRLLAALGGVAVVTAAWTMASVPMAALPGAGGATAVLLPLGVAVGLAVLAYAVLLARGPIVAGYLAIAIGLALALLLGTG